MGQEVAWLLDQEPPVGYVREWTERVAAGRGILHETVATAFVFRLGFEWLALPVSLLQEVMEPGPIHQIPHRVGGFLRGVTNVRGSMLICVALDKLLKLDAAAGYVPEPANPPGGSNSVRPRFLVLGLNGHSVVTGVDEVHGLVRYGAADLRSTPATLDLGAGVYTSRMLDWSGRTVGLLDGELLFYSLQRSLTWIQGGPRT